MKKYKKLCLLLLLVLVLTSFNQTLLASSYNYNMNNSKDDITPLYNIPIGIPYSGCHLTSPGINILYVTEEYNGHYYAGYVKRKSGTGCTFEGFLDLVGDASPLL